MSIQTEIDRITAAKEAIVATLTEKGVSVGGGKLEDLSEAIKDISTGIDGTTGQFLLTANQSEYVIEHGLGKIPSVFVIFTNKDYQTMSGNYRLIMAVACDTSNVQYRFTYSKRKKSLSAAMENSTAWTETTEGNMITYMTEQSTKICPGNGSYQLSANTLYTWITLGEN